MTEQLLTEGGMQWAYSELFQNYSGREVASLPGLQHQAERGAPGLLVHYSETHDNDAAGGARTGLVAAAQPLVRAGERERAATDSPAAWNGWRRNESMSIPAAAWPGEARTNDSGTGAAEPVAGGSSLFF